MQKKFDITRRKFLGSAAALAARAPAGPVGVVAKRILASGGEVSALAHDVSEAVRIFEGVWDDFYGDFSWYSDIAMFTGTELEGHVSEKLELYLPQLWGNVRKLYDARQAILTGDAAKDTLTKNMLHEIIDTKKKYYIRELARLAIDFPDPNPSLRADHLMWAGEADWKKIDRQVATDRFRDLRIETAAYYRGEAIEEKEGSTLLDLRKMSLSSLINYFEDIKYTAHVYEHLTPEMSRAIDASFNGLDSVVKRLANLADIDVSLAHVLTDVTSSCLLAGEDEDRLGHEFIDVLFDDKKLFDQLSVLVGGNADAVAHSFSNRDEAIRTQKNIDYAAKILPQEVKKAYVTAFQQAFPHIDSATISLPEVDPKTIEHLLNLEPEELEELVSENIENSTSSSLRTIASSLRQTSSETTGPINSIEEKPELPAVEELSAEPPKLEI